jgi:hypothetical protein
MPCARSTISGRLGGSWRSCLGSCISSDRTIRGLALSSAYASRALVSFSSFADARDNVNFGRGQPVPGQKRVGVKVHRIVKTRMDADGLEGGKYLEVEPIWVDCPSTALIQLSQPRDFQILETPRHNQFFQLLVQAGVE